MNITKTYFMVPLQTWTMPTFYRDALGLSQLLFAALVRTYVARCDYGAAPRRGRGRTRGLARLRSR